jgi:hypothetical protein
MWTKSYNGLPGRSRQTENLIVDPIGQNAEFILQVAVHIRERDELEKCIALAGGIFTGIKIVCRTNLLVLLHPMKG